MAKFVECMRFDGKGFVALRADHIASVNPMFVDGTDDFSHSIVIMSNGTVFAVNEVWEQIADAMEEDKFSALTPTLEATFG